ncbi:unnamed protein product [Rotaria socialis]
MTSTEPKLLVEVPDHHIHKRVVFRNQAHRILEAIRLPGFSIGNQPILFSFNETNENYFKSSNTTSINISQQQPTPSVSFVFNTATIVPSSTGYIRNDCSSVMHTNQHIPSSSLEDFRQTIHTVLQYRLKQQVLLVHPKEWTTAQVGKFIRHITNDFIAQDFVKNDIDGEGLLLLLTKDDSFYDMKIVLGPSIKILNKITNIRMLEQVYA